MKKMMLVLVLVFSIMLTGCASADEAINKDGYYGDEFSDNDTDPEPPAADNDEVILEGGDVIQTGDVPALLNRKIIYTATLGISSESPEDVYIEVMESLNTYGAYIESETITSNKYIVKIRVLSENFTDFIDEIKQSGEVQNYSKTSEDITNAYSTFEARKLALETQQARIIELIAVAEDLSDILTLEEARAEIEAELNEIGDSLANFDSLVDYSTINLTITEATEQVVILPQTDSPSVEIIETTKNTSEIEVTNRDDSPAIIYVDLLQNGEFLRQYEGEAFPNGSVVFEIDDLKSNTEYSFKITSISSDHRESNVVTRDILTESTFFNKVGNIFVQSFNVLIAIFEFMGLAIVALAPFVIVAIILVIPSRILYSKFLKDYLKNKKAKRDEAMNQKTQARIKHEEELKYARMQQQKEIKERHDHMKKEQNNQ